MEGLSAPVIALYYVVLGSRGRTGLSVAVNVVKIKKKVRARVLIQAEY
jgi:hypothetical protein